MVDETFTCLSWRLVEAFSHRLPSKRGPLSRDDIYNHTDHQGNLQEASRLSLNVLLFSFGLPVCNAHPIYIWALSSKNHPSAVSCIFSVWPKIAFHVCTGWISLLYILGEKAAFGHLHP